jgi:hypothetical protein
MVFIASGVSVVVDGLAGADGASLSTVPPPPQADTAVSAARAKPAADLRKTRLTFPEASSRCAGL